MTRAGPNPVFATEGRWDSSLTESRVSYPMRCACATLALGFICGLI
jgi:hypothetical protein